SRFRIGVAPRPGGRPGAIRLLLFQLVVKLARRVRGQQRGKARVGRGRNLQRLEPVAAPLRRVAHDGLGNGLLQPLLHDRAQRRREAGRAGQAQQAEQRVHVDGDIGRFQILQQAGAH
ncbi:hypothetical protein RZS08_47535, partial [Arthrospira platensis SPKY1]|nr:hypothetical protein [Arthrospira platensis SPKY1]